MKGYVVVFEGDDESGYSAYSPDLPAVVAAGATRQETKELMIEAMGRAYRRAPRTRPAGSVAIAHPPGCYSSQAFKRLVLSNTSS